MNSRNMLKMAGFAYGGFCLVNWAINYMAARSGSPTLLGSATLLDLNTKLTPFNILAKIIDPLAVAQRVGTSSSAGNAPAPSSAGVPPLLALPTGMNAQPVFDPNWLGL